jgi:hypothetical protein
LIGSAAIGPNGDGIASLIAIASPYSYGYTIVSLIIESRRVPYGDGVVPLGIIPGTYSYGDTTDSLLALARVLPNSSGIRLLI